MNFMRRRSLCTLSLQLLIVIADCAPTTSYAATMTGQQLAAKLDMPIDSRERLEGVMLIGNVLFEWEGKSHCKPQAATLGQAAAIAKNFLQANPQLLHYDASTLVGVALGENWPCPIQGRRK